MASNKRNLLTKIVIIQNITLESRKNGATYTWIFQNLIQPRFITITWQTYYRYLGTNAKAELKKLENADKDF